MPGDDFTPDEISNKKTWIITPPKDGVIDINFYDSLRELLKPYTPAEKEADADEMFSTKELLLALEEHYAIPQGDAQAPGLDGEKLITHMTELGYKCENIGGLKLLWLLKKKPAS